MMVRTLRDVGFSTIEAGNGDEGLSRFKAHQPDIDLAIIEMLIPAMSGLDLAVQLERLQPDMNILYMSALHESIAMESIARRSPERVLLKPFNSQDLCQRARHLLPNASRIQHVDLRHTKYRRTAGCTD